MFRSAFRASRPTLDRFRPGSLPAPGRVKQTTGITGINVHPTPLRDLHLTYEKTLEVLRTMPTSAVYRQGAEALTKQRLDAVNAALDAKKSPEDVEAALPAELGPQGLQLEEILLEAQSELRLAGKMVEWKAWEPLQVKPAPGQWSYFDAPSAARTDEA